MCIVMLVIMTETTADILAVGEIIGTHGRPQDASPPACGPTWLSTAVVAVFNGFPVSAFAQNVGLVAITGIKSRFVVAAGGGILVVLGLLPDPRARSSPRPAARARRRRHRAVRLRRGQRHPHASAGSTSRNANLRDRRVLARHRHHPDRRAGRSTTTSPSGSQTIFDSGHQRDGDLRGPAEHRCSTTSRRPTSRRRPSTERSASAGTRWRWLSARRMYRKPLPVHRGRPRTMPV